MTMQDMCEEIEKAGFLFSPRDGHQLTAREIFEYSPTGELFRVFEWYEIAKRLNAWKENSNGD